MEGILKDHNYKGSQGAKTDFDTLKELAVYMTNYLKEVQMIDFDVDKREELVDKMATEFSVSFATDEDICDQALEEVEEKIGAENVPEDVTDSEMFNHARKEIIKSFSGENIGGLYLAESLHQAAQRTSAFLMDCDLIEDVYGEDEELSSLLIKRFRAFSPKKN